jgi:hypothetical protein
MPDLFQAIHGALLALADHPALIPALLAVGLAGTGARLCRLRRRHAVHAVRDDPV